MSIRLGSTAIPELQDSHEAMDALSDFAILHTLRSGLTPQSLEEMEYDRYMLLATCCTAYNEKTAESYERASRPSRSSMHLYPPTLNIVGENMG